MVYSFVTRFDNPKKIINWHVNMYFRLTITLFKVNKKLKQHALFNTPVVIIVTLKKIFLVRN